MNVTLNETPSGKQTVDMTVVLDGYNAPVSAGNFLDLVRPAHPLHTAGTVNWLISRQRVVNRTMNRTVVEAVATR